MSAGQQGNGKPVGRWKFEKAVRKSALPQHLKRTAQAVAVYADVETGGGCHPGAKLLAKDTGVSTRTIEGNLRDLSRLGWLHLIWSGRGNNRLASIWQLCKPLPDASQPEANRKPTGSLTSGSGLPNTKTYTTNTDSPPAAGCGGIVAWTTEEDDYLLEQIQTMPKEYTPERKVWVTEIAEEIGRTPGAIYSRIKKLSDSAPEGDEEEEEAAISEHDAYEIRASYLASALNQRLVVGTTFFWNGRLTTIGYRAQVPGVTGDHGNSAYQVSGWEVTIEDEEMERWRLSVKRP